jgi:hypothetical protein
MGWTKRQLIEQAFEEIGMASYAFDLTPDQEQSALRRMDSMVAGWGSNGIRIGYPLTSRPEDSDIEAETSIADFAAEAVYLNLAVRLAPSFGKVISPETKAFASDAYSNVVSASVILPMERQLGALPKGQGAKPWRTNTPFSSPPQDSLLAESDNIIKFN